MDRLTLVFGEDCAGLSVEDAARQSKRLFARSEGQLAVLGRPVGSGSHRLTSWEALMAYGIETLEDAIEYGTAILKVSADPAAGALTSRRNDLGVTPRSVSRAAHVSETDVIAAESGAQGVPFSKLEQIAFSLGLDERLLAFDPSAGSDSELAYRLRVLHSEHRTGHVPISAGVALLFAEAASIIRVQCRLQDWLGVSSGLGNFLKEPNFGNSFPPAWQIGYRLATKARDILQLGDRPVPSMRDLLETTLGIPVIQAQLPSTIAGATIVTSRDDGSEARGVVINTVGDNDNVWIRRATLAHELGHLLFDPDSELDRVRVDSYTGTKRDPQGNTTDFVEQRANAFAVAFLAPNEAVRQIAIPPITREAVATTMGHFGISYTAAGYHIANCHYRQYDVPNYSSLPGPSNGWKAAENFTIDYFPLARTPIQRRGRFARLVVQSFDDGLISEDTASFYLCCSTDDFLEQLSSLRDILG